MLMYFRFGTVTVLSRFGRSTAKVQSKYGEDSGRGTAK